jgi:DNA helicase-2/ATP-dependent DNA helicase PcrA
MTSRRFPHKATCLAIYSRVVNSQAPLCEVLSNDYLWCAQWEAELKKLFEGYVQAKQAQNVLDYDDLLLYWATMLAEPRLAREVGARFDHSRRRIPDTNRSKVDPAGETGWQGVTVAGDDAQSIYSFRAATIRNILDFPSHFSPAAHVVTLERNYRSTQPILDACNAVIGLASERYTKDLWTERLSSDKPQLIAVRDEADQARCVAERVLLYREMASR